MGVQDSWYEDSKSQNNHILKISPRPILYFLRNQCLLQVCYKRQFVAGRSCCRSNTVLYKSDTIFYGSDIFFYKEYNSIFFQTSNTFHGFV